MPNIDDETWTDLAAIPGFEGQRGIQYARCVWQLKNFSVAGLLNIFTVSKDNLAVVLETAVQMKTHDILTGAEINAAANKIDAMITDLQNAKTNLTT